MINFQIFFTNKITDDLQQKFSLFFQMTDYRS